MSLTAVVLGVDEIFEDETETARRTVRDRTLVAPAVY